jgi:hypothetical protein
MPDSTKMTRVLSFDVGTKNLSLCDVSVKACGDFEVNAWSVVSTVAPGLNVNLTPVWDLAPPFYDYLQKNARSWLFDADGSPKTLDRVLIENQPMGGRGAARNLKTKVLSHILQCVILGLRPDLTVAFVHPGLKLKDMPLTDPGRKNTYRENKTYAIETTGRMLETSNCLTKAYCTEVYGAKKIKKDDLADAFLQGYFVAQIMARGDLVPNIDVPKIAPLDAEKPSKGKKRKAEAEKAPRAKKAKKQDIKDVIASEAIPEKVEEAPVAEAPVAESPKKKSASPKRASTKK